MQKITDLFATKERTFSFEFFPPKTPKGLEALYGNAGTLAQLAPDYVSVTYGAGGFDQQEHAGDHCHAE